ncbi:MAG: hypothetical protein WCP70_02250 [Methanothrix sp.]
MIDALAASRPAVARIRAFRGELGSSRSHHLHFLDYPQEEYFRLAWVGFNNEKMPI